MKKATPSLPSSSRMQMPSTSTKKVSSMGKPKKTTTNKVMAMAAKGKKMPAKKGY
jgi:hypothetical protein